VTALYDRIGGSYATTRRGDPRIAAFIAEALGDARSVISGIVAAIEDELPSVTARPFRLPRNCSDGVGTAYWGQPEMYCDEDVRRNISNFATGDPDEIARGLERLRDDLASGAWDRKYGHLRTLPELDLGHRVMVSELS